MFLVSSRVEFLSCLVFFHKSPGFMLEHLWMSSALDVLLDSEEPVLSEDVPEVAVEVELWPDWISSTLKLEFAAFMLDLRSIFASWEVLPDSALLLGLGGDICFCFFFFLLYFVPFLPDLCSFSDSVVLVSKFGKKSGGNCSLVAASSFVSSSSFFGVTWKVSKVQKQNLKPAFF